MQAVEPAVAHILDTHGLQIGLGLFTIEVGDRIADVLDGSLALAARRSAFRRRIQITRADDQMRQRHVVRRYAERLLAALAERKSNVGLGRTDLIEIEDFGIPVRALPKVRT